jgi:hypothetical protein
VKLSEVGGSWEDERKWDESEKGRDEIRGGTLGVLVPMFLDIF